MAVRTANARWEGSLREGRGTMALGSGAFEGQYSYSSRFEEGTGTNPEELAARLDVELDRAVELLKQGVEPEAARAMLLSGGRPPA